MKDLIKKWWFGVIIIAIVIIIVSIFSELKTKGVGSAGVSLEEYQKIELGMSENTVTKIIDSNDEWFEDSIYEKCCQEVEKSKDNHKYRYTYKYIGDKGGYALITYEADYSNGDMFVLPTVSKKEEHNLK